MIDNLKDTSPAAERGCRLTALMESGGIAKVDLNEKHQNFARQKRLNVRRLKKLSENFRFYAADYRYYKRKKPENNSVTDGVITVDQVQLGTTSSEVKTVRERLQRVTCGSHGLISLIGRRREMEDAVTVKPGLLSKGNRKYDFFGVYDGHGGSRAAHVCREWLHRLVIEEVVEEEDEESINWEKVMRESFVKMDEEVEKNGAEMATMGSTAVVAMVSEEEVIVANCGDSRAVLSRGGVTVPLSIDHKPDRPDELDRIENSGGKVINWNGHRVLGVLATSRSIGDTYLKPYVIPDPEVKVSKRTDADEFLILASDGLWDVIPNDVACDVTRRCLNGQMKRPCSQQSKSHSKINEKDEQTSDEVKKENLAAQAASFLAELAIARGSEDNISVIVIELNRSVCSTSK
ncbi:protein phosphatase 2C 51 [Nicotiana tabacum]|uniref:protein-serine/threonine phosphatase n=2 Tax=Nicotiana TaxID=4085 RepID=A0A1S4CK88_TOBAC|nr:PREDICTED: probable protein phosphatase 2C 51 [Nicotiana sylvestris]XP_016501329.1 PREDICTED: probable protein phosphatase 2C 51 [Nicotiana tabacum]